MDNIFRKDFAGFGELCHKSMHYLFYQPTAINLKPIMTSLDFYPVKGVP